MLLESHRHGLVATTLMELWGGLLEPPLPSLSLSHTLSPSLSLSVRLSWSAGPGHNSHSVQSSAETEQSSPAGTKLAL